ncbi:MAG: ribonuclease J [bacterium]
MTATRSLKRTRKGAAPRGTGPDQAKPPKSGRGRLQIVALGGLGEIGKNATLIQAGGDALLIDAGLRFPEEELLGIDLVIPDFSLIASQRVRLHGVVLTHGHEDHIGALPFLLEHQQPVVIGSPLTVALAKERAAERGREARWRPTGYREEVTLGPFRVELVRVSHSIPGAAAVVVRASGGTVVVSGDFKFDQTPVDGRPTDVARLAEVGEAGVTALLLDSTNSERSGYTPSERVAGEGLARQVAGRRGRVIVTTFASNVHRLQQVIDLAASTDRRVGVVGRSMEQSVRIAQATGHLKAPPGLLATVEEARHLPDRRVIILITGSQGEPLAGLSRVAAGTHRALTLKRGDTVIFSASAIPGNEAVVSRTIDNLFRRGAEVVYGRESGVHVSGHGAAEELKLMTNLLRPQVFIPVHGEYRMLVQNSRLAAQTGIPSSRILVGENGSIFEIGAHPRIAGRLAAGNVLVDGLGVGDVGAVVLRDRQHLARDGIVIVLLGLDQASGEIISGPDVVSRGFVYMREAEPLLAEVRERVGETMKRLQKTHGTDWAAVKSAIREDLSRFLYERTKRQPMILPMVVEV